MTKWEYVFKIPCDALKMLVKLKLTWWWCNGAGPLCMAHSHIKAIEVDYFVMQSAHV